MMGVADSQDAALEVRSDSGASLRGRGVKGSITYLELPEPAEAESLETLVSRLHLCQRFVQRNPKILESIAHLEETVLSADDDQEVPETETELQSC